jgi:hypothetical protein
MHILFNLADEQQESLYHLLGLLLRGTVEQAQQFPVNLVHIAIISAAGHCPGHTKITRIIGSKKVPWWSP